MKFVALTTPDEILQAKKLLYQFYVEQLGWSPETGNPSNFRIVLDCTGAYLDDNLAAQSRYFGLLSGDRLMACCRMISGGPADLEVSRYTQLPDAFSSFEKITEVNRIAVDSLDSRHLSVPLIYHCLKTVSEQNAELVLTTANYPQPGELLVKLGFEKGPEFRYSSSDLEPVYVFSLEMQTARAQMALEALAALIKQGQ